MPCFYALPKALSISYTYIYTHTITNNGLLSILSLNSIKKPMEFISIPFIFFVNSIHFLRDSLSSLSTHPLFSTIVTLHTLILIYTPSLFIAIAFSPLLNSTGILLLSLLRLGTDETSEKEFGRSESRIFCSDGNQRLENESGSPNSHYNHLKGVPIEEGLVVESDSLKSRFLDFTEQNQTHVEFEPKTDLGSKSSHTHVKSEPKFGLGSEFNKSQVEFKPKTSLRFVSDHVCGLSEPNTCLGSESYQTHMEFESKTDLGSNFNQIHMRFESNTNLDSKSDQTHVEFESKTHIDSTSGQNKPNSGPKTGLGSESNQTHIESYLDTEPVSEDDYHKWELQETISIESPQVVEEEDPRTKTDSEPADTSGSGHGSGSIQLYEDPFLEWTIGAPLEIIYEAYEGEEKDEIDEDEERNGNDDVSGEKRVVGPERYPSLSMYYPESDTDSSSDGEFPVIGDWETQESVIFKWEEEEREELIEISLDRRYGKKSIEFCRFEEDNLIEIDICPARS